MLLYFLEAWFCLNRCARLEREKYLHLDLKSDSTNAIKLGKHFQLSKLMVSMSFLIIFKMTAIVCSANLQLCTIVLT